METTAGDEGKTPEAGKNAVAATLQLDAHDALSPQWLPMFWQASQLTRASKGDATKPFSLSTCCQQRLWNGLESRKIVSLARPACLGASRALADTLQMHGRLAVSHAIKRMVSNADHRGMDAHCFSTWGTPPVSRGILPVSREFRPFPGEFRPRCGPENSAHWTRTRCQELPAYCEGLTHHQAFPEIKRNARL